MIVALLVFVVVVVFVIVVVVVVAVAVVGIYNDTINNSSQHIALKICTSAWPSVP